MDRKVAEAKADEKRSVKKYTTPSYVSFLNSYPFFLIRKRKKDMKEKRKKKQRLDLQMIIPGDQPDNPEESDLFNLRAIKKQAREFFHQFCKTNLLNCVLRLERS